MKKTNIVLKIVRLLCGTMCIMFSLFAGFGIYSQAVLPDKFYVAEGQMLKLPSRIPIKATGLVSKLPIDVYAKAGNSFNVELSTLGNAKIKKVNVQVVERKLLIPGGMPFGIKMFTKGVMVVGMSNIQTANGIENPAKSCGIRVGDIITQINGKDVTFNEQISEIVDSSNGNAITVKLKRNENDLSIILKPALCSDDKNYKAGIWVRDSSAGIGTMSFIDPENMKFGGLGHAVCDVDTEQILPLSSGEITNVMITGVKKGESGHPGELKGVFTNSNNVGNLYLNTQTGIFGILNKDEVNGYAIPIAFRQEIKEGPAKILTTLSGNTPCEYEIMIEKINFTANTPTKNMIIRITDPELLAKAGGIVQGMSGSPIVQDQKIVGAVTHVFVNDPTRGYGIFIENMVDSANQIKTQSKAA